MHVRAIPTYSLCIADLLKGMIIQVLSQLQKFSYQYKLSRAHDDIVIIVAEKEECVTYSPCGCVDKGIEKVRAGRLLLQVLDEASIELTFYFEYTQEILPVSNFAHSSSFVAITMMSSCALERLQSDCYAQNF